MFIRVFCEPYGTKFEPFIRRSPASKRADRGLK